MSLRGLARRDVFLCHCEQGEAINRHRIPMILASHTVGCHARTLCSLAMTKIDIKIFGGATLVAHFVCDSCLCAVKTAPPKIPFVMLSVSETSLCDSILCIFRQGGQGGYLRSAPLIPLNNPPNPLTLLKGLCSARTMSCSTAHASTLCLRLEHCRCALWLGR